MRISSKFGLTALIALTAILSLLVILKTRDAGPKATSSGRRQIRSLNLIRESGERISTKNFGGRNVYIQFVDPSYETDIKTLELVFDNWHERGLYIVGIVNDIESFLQRTKLKPSDIILTHQDYQDLKNIFRSPLSISTFHIFDEKGNEFASGQSLDGYENRVRVLLNQLIDNKLFKIESFVDNKKNISEMEWLRQCAEFIKTAPGKRGFIFGYFTNICETCLTGTIVKRLNDFYERDADTFSVVIILGSNYSDSDLLNMRDVFNIDCALSIQSVQLFEYVWPISLEFGKDILNNTIFFVNSTGKILKVFHNNCACWDSFSSYIEEFPSLVLGSPILSSEER